MTFLRRKQHSEFQFNQSTVLLLSCFFSTNVVKELVFDDLRHEAVNSLNGCLGAEISQHNSYGKKKTIECSGNVHETQDNVKCTFLNVKCTFLIQQMLRYATLRYVILGFVMLRCVTLLDLCTPLTYPSLSLSAFLLLSCLDLFPLQNCPCGQPNRGEAIQA